MSRPQFSLKTMLGMVALVGAGIFLGSVNSESAVITCLFAMLGTACWGAAVGSPFGLARRGAAIGALLILALVACAWYGG